MCFKLKPNLLSFCFSDAYDKFIWTGLYNPDEIVCNTAGNIGPKNLECSGKLKWIDGSDFIMTDQDLLYFNSSLKINDNIKCIQYRGDNSRFADIDCTVKRHILCQKDCVQGEKKTVALHN